MIATRKWEKKGNDEYCWNNKVQCRCSRELYFVVYGNGHWPVSIHFGIFSCASPPFGPTVWNESRVIGIQESYYILVINNLTPTLAIVNCRIDFLSYRVCICMRCLISSMGFVVDSRWKLADFVYSFVGRIWLAPSRSWVSCFSEWNIHQEIYKPFFSALKPKPPSSSTYIWYQ